MEAYANVLLYAIPGFMVLMILEQLAAIYQGKTVYRSFDFVSSISSGMTNTLKSMVGLTFIIISYEWMLEHMAIFEIKSTFWIYFGCFIGVDFAAYWSHRFNHHINLMWNNHIVHHSSEDYNLACALRQSISVFIQYYFFLNIPLAILGIPTEVFNIVLPLHLFAQFWYHTVLIDKMGFLEYIIMTPSHHRVHHAINDIYLDRNFSAILILWDKLFGTFQAELKEEPPVYGVKKPVETWNPYLINFMHFWQLCKDAYHAENWNDKFLIWIKPTGWRPKDVSLKYPIDITEDVHKRPKYDTPASSNMHIWIWGQFIILQGMILHLLTMVGDIPLYQINLYVIFIAISIFAYTALMDRVKYSLYFEAIKFCLGIVILIKYEWFEINAIFPQASLFVGGYLFLAFLMNYYFLFVDVHSKLEYQIQ